MQDSEHPRSEPPAQRRSERLKVALLVVLLVVAGILAWRNYEPSVVKWHLGTLRANPADPGARAALRRLGPRLYPYLREELASDDPDSRFVAILAMSVLEGPEVERMLARASRDEDPLNAINAISVLHERGRGGSALVALLPLLEAPAPVMRFAARRMAGRIVGLPWWAYGRPGKAERAAATGGGGGG